MKIRRRTHGKADQNLARHGVDAAARYGQDLWACGPFFARRDRAKGGRGWPAPDIVSALRIS